MIGGGGFKMSRPRTLVCYVCGREYGTHSLGIHIKTCIKKFEVQESLKHVRDRRPLPRPPPGLIKMLDKKTISELDFTAYNEGAFQEFNTAVLVPCVNCGRTFSESALKHHARACTASKPLKARVGAGVNMNNDRENIGILKKPSHSMQAKGMPYNQQQGRSQNRFEHEKKRENPKIYEQQFEDDDESDEDQVEDLYEYEIISKKNPNFKKHISQEELDRLFGEIDRGQQKPNPKYAQRGKVNSQMNSHQPNNSNKKNNFINNSKNVLASYGGQDESSESYNSYSTNPTVGNYKDHLNRVKPKVPDYRKSNNYRSEYDQDDSELSFGMADMKRPNTNNGKIPSKQKNYEINTKKVSMRAKPAFGGGNFNDPYDNFGDMDEQGGNVAMSECGKCGRTFAQDRIAKHQKVCKVNAKPKKVHLFHKPAPPEPKYQAKYNDIKVPKQAVWRQQHADFMQAMRYNRVCENAERKGIKLSSLPPPPPSAPDPSLIPCPHCGRRFGQQQAERHIPKCRTTINKPAPPPRRPQPPVSSNNRLISSSSGYGTNPYSGGKAPANAGIKRNSNYRKLY